jgi:hypothetical protein
VPALTESGIMKTKFVLVLALFAGLIAGTADLTHDAVVQCGRAVLEDFSHADAAAAAAVGYGD